MPKDATTRIEAFSDGVFAIAITLLVLDIHVPRLKDGGSLSQALLADWKTYLAFLIGFFTLLVCWINHHYMFEHINEQDDRLLLFNGFKLLVVSFTPFATALISEYIGTAHQQAAASIYAGNFFLMGSAMSCLWGYANGKGFTSHDSPQGLRAASKFYIFASVLSGIIFIVSFFNIVVTLILFGIMFLVFVFPKDRVRRLAKMEERKHLALTGTNS
jgi:uncharacterized membrane protein